MEGMQSKIVGRGCMQVRRISLVCYVVAEALGEGTQPQSTNRGLHAIVEGLGEGMQSQDDNRGSWPVP